MKKNRLLLLFVAVMLGLLSACGTPPTSTPTPVVPTDVPADTEVPTMEPMLTETETPVMATATVETATPTATGPAGTVPVQLVCWFCIQQVPHVMVAMPQSATFTVKASSPVTCNSVETVGDQQLVLCQGPKQSGSVSFDLNVCSNGNCSDRHLAAVDCSATAVPTQTSTVTPTTTGTVTPAAGSVATQTPTKGAGASATATPVLEVIRTSTATMVSTATPTP